MENIEITKSDDKIEFSYMKDCDTKVILSVSQFDEFDLTGYGLSTEDDEIDVITWTRHYSIGKKHNHNTDEIDEIYPSDQWYKFNLYMYDHSGLLFSLEPFSCPWDSGQIGYIFINRDAFTDESQARSYANSIIREQNDLEIGNVWSYMIEEQTKCKCCNQITTDVKDSCSGFIGDIAYSGLVDHIPVQFNEAFKKHYNIQ